MPSDGDVTSSDESEPPSPPAVFYDSKPKFATRQPTPPAVFYDSKPALATRRGDATMPANGKWAANKVKVEPAEEGPTKEKSFAKFSTQSSSLSLKGEEGGSDAHSHGHGHGHPGARIGVHLFDEDHMPGKAGMVELFFDLIFVAAMFRLGTVFATGIKQGKYSEITWHCGLLFSVLWLTWHHCNMLKTRFLVAVPYNILEFLVMAMTLLLAVAMVDYHHDDTNPDPFPTSALLTRKFHIIWCISRVIFLLLYLAAWWYNPKARRMCSIYSGCFAVTALLNFIAVLVDTVDAHTTITVVVVLSELLMYPLALLLTKKSEVIGIDVEHNIERAELWAVLIMGESMMSLVEGHGYYYEYENVQFYYTLLLGFGLIFTVMQLYCKSQPDVHSGLDTHTFDLSLLGSVYFDISQLLSTFGIWVLGVGLKFAITYGHYESAETHVKEGGKYKRVYAWVLCLGCSGSLFWMTCGRLIHDWAWYRVFQIGGHGGVNRKVVWVIHVMCAFALLPLPLLVKTGKEDDGHSGYNYVSNGLSTAQLLACILAILWVSLAFDLLSAPPQSVHRALADFKKEMSKIQKSEQLDGVDSTVDKGTLATMTTAASGSAQIRGGGTKGIKFSGKRMAMAVLDSHKSDKPESIFGAFQKILDRDDPDNAFSNKSLANWDKGARRFSNLQKAAGGFNMGGMGGMKNPAAKAGVVSQSVAIEEEEELSYESDVVNLDSSRTSH